MPEEAMRSVTALPHGRRAHMGDLRILIFPHRCQHLTLSVFFIIGVLVGMKCYFICAFDLVWCSRTCRASFYMFFYWLFVYLLCRNGYSNPLLTFKVGYLSFDRWVVSILLYIFWMWVSFWYIICSNTVPFWGCLFNFLIAFSVALKFLILMTSNLSILLWLLVL